MVLLPFLNIRCIALSAIFWLSLICGLLYFYLAILDLPLRPPKVRAEDP